MTSAPVVFVDIETTGLIPGVHEIFEIALIDAAGYEESYWIECSLTTADPTALRLTHFYERQPNQTDLLRSGPVAKTIAHATAGQHLVGAVPSFDAAFLDVFLRRHSFVPAWHYHLVDVEALAAGKLGIEPPWDSEELSEKLGVEPDRFDRHTALGDARWARAIYEAVFS